MWGAPDPSSTRLRLAAGPIGESLRSTTRSAPGGPESDPPAGSRLPSSTTTTRKPGCV